MKKIIAIALVLTFMLTLVSCGAGSFKKHKEEVEAREFYEELHDALKLDDEDAFMRSLKVKASETSFEKSVTEYDDGVTVRENIFTFVNADAKYSLTDEIFSYRVSSAAIEHAPEGLGLVNTKQENIYLQDGSSMLEFDKMRKTCTESENDEDGVQNTVNGRMAAFLNAAFGDAIKYAYLKGDASDIVGDGIVGDIVDSVLDSAYENIFGDDVDVEYYIDGNVYTVVYSEEEFVSNNVYLSIDDITTKKEITVQIIVRDNKISVTRESNTSVTRERVDYYVKEETINEKYELEIKFANVYVKEPNIEKYHME